MKLELNHRPTELAGERLSVADLLKAMHFTFPLIVVKLNGELVRREAFSRTMIREGDRVEAIHLISGG